MNTFFLRLSVVLHSVAKRRCVNKSRLESEA